MMATSHSIRKTAVAAALAVVVLGAATVFTNSLTTARAASASSARSDFDSQSAGQILSVQQEVQLCRQASGLLEEQTDARLTFLEKIDAQQKAAEAESAQKAARKERKRQGVATGSFLWPVPSVDASAVSSGVGPRWGTAHNGIDILAEQGSDIVAADGGTVYISENGCTHYYGGCGCGGGFGNYVMIDHGNGYFTTYGHMTEALVQTGDKVAKGQKIGTVGSTGYSTGFHLHLELRQGFYGAVLDPLDYIEA